MVMLVRCGGEEEDDGGDDEGSEWLLKGLTHQCSLTLQVQGLPTGYCRDIHGQVTLSLTRFLIDLLRLCHPGIEEIKSGQMRTQSTFSLLVSLLIISFFSLLRSHHLLLLLNESDKLEFVQAAYFTQAEILPASSV